MTQILELAKKLIEFKSVSSNLDEINKCIDFIKYYFKDTNLIIKEHIKNNKPSLVITFTDTKTPKVFFSGHIDVVPVQNEKQFTPIIDGDKLIGRGAADMKTAVATFMHIFKQLSKENKTPDIGLMIVSDEEIGGFNCSGHLVDLGYKSEFFLAGEITNLQVGNMAKGILSFDVKTKGLGAHSAYAWQGENAIEKMMKALNDINSLFEKPQDHTYKTTCNIATISGGKAMNMVPENCQARIDIRYVPTDNSNEILSKIKQLSPNIQIEQALNEPACLCDEQNPYIQKLINLGAKGFIKKHGGSDARFFSKIGIPAIVFGPVGYNIHCENEYLEISSIEKFKEIIEKFIEQI